MSLNVDDLAEVIKDAIGATDKDGNPIEVTSEMKAYSEAIISTLTASNFSHTSVTGNTTAASPLQNGAAQGGLFNSLSSSIWLDKMTSGFPDAESDALSEEADSSTSYLQGAALINFEAGEITGQCTSTAEAPGPLVNGAGQGGEISGIEGAAWASVVNPPTGDPEFSEKLYKAITNYIKENTEATYAPNSVTGVCPSSSGPLQGGVGVGGIIS